VLDRHSQIVAQRAETELAELAHELHAREVDPFTILLELGRRNAQLGCPRREVLSIVRDLPGLKKWRPLSDAWRARMNAIDPEEAVAGLTAPEMEERNRRRRAYALAQWCQFHAGKRIVEEVVVAAGDIACRHLENVA
jgi:hypothetical protein